MHNKLNRLVVISSVALLTACSGNVKENLGLKRDAPDEFRVISKPPLSIPPNFNLRPPREGESALPQSAMRDEAKEILFAPEGQENAVTKNNGEEILLQKIGIGSGDPDIRKVLHEEQQQYSPEEEENKGFFKKILSKNPAEKPDPIVNAKKESKRIRDNVKNNKPITKGETPTVQPGGKGVLQNILSGNSE